MFEFVKKFFNKQEAVVSEKTRQYYVDESVNSNWFYHIREWGKTKSLCGKEVLQKELPMDLWGYKGHNNERYCEYCKRIYSNVF